MARLEGNILKFFDKIAKTSLFILDDFGLTNMEQQQQFDLMEIVEDRHGKKSTIIASQLPIASWYDIISEATIADYPNFFIMRSNIMVCVVNHQLSCPNSTIYFA